MNPEWSGPSGNKEMGRSNLRDASPTKNMLHNVAVWGPYIVHRVILLVGVDLVWGNFVHDKLSIVIRDPRAAATVKSINLRAATSVTAVTLHDAETNSRPTDESCSSCCIAFGALLNCVLVLSTTKVEIEAGVAALEFECSFDAMKGHSNMKQ
jgi:hypothetical protein